MPIKAWFQIMSSMQWLEQAVYIYFQDPKDGLRKKQSNTKGNEAKLFQLHNMKVFDNSCA